MTGGAIHTALVVGAHFPILPAETCVTMTASAQVSGTVYRHGSFGMVCWRGPVAGFTGHTIFLKRCRSRIIAGCMADETSTRLALLCPVRQEDGVTACFSVRAVLPGHLIF